MHITFDSVINVLTIVMTIVSALLGSKVVLGNRAQKVLMAIAAAEHLIDRSAYNDGKLDETRVEVAVAVLQKIAPKLDPNVARADIEKLLGVIHEHANDASAAIPAPAVK